MKKITAIIAIAFVAFSAFTTKTNEVTFGLQDRFAASGGDVWYEVVILNEEEIEFSCPDESEGIGCFVTIDLDTQISQTNPIDDNVVQYKVPSAHVTTVDGTIPNEREFVWSPL